MGKLPQPTIPDKEWETRINDLCISLDSKGRGDFKEVNELFMLYNDRVPSVWRPNEYGKSCHTCVSRVWKKVKAYWEANIKDKPKDVTIGSTGSIPPEPSEK